MNQSHLSLRASYSTLPKSRASLEPKEMLLTETYVPSRLSTKINNPNSKAYPSALRKVVELYGASNRDFDVTTFLRIDPCF